MGQWDRQLKSFTKTSSHLCPTIKLLRFEHMKILVSNGRSLTVRDVGPILGKWIAPPRGMVPFHGSKIVEDDEAKRLIREALAVGCVRAEP